MQRLVIITGASRGIGKEIALQTNKNFSDKKTTFLLIARSLIDLNEVANEMSAANNLSVVITLQYDFSQVDKTEGIKNLIKTKLPELNIFDELYVFYNHGTLKIESVEKVADHATAEFQINVVSVWTLLSAIRDLFPIESVQKQFHIDTSSLLAVVQVKMMSVYCSVKAARASIFKSLALERPELRVLIYQPGPIYTDMLKNIYNNIKSSSEKISLPDNWLEKYDNGELLTCEQTVKHLLDIIEKNEFKNGQAVDYYDQFN